jgi:type I restriction enzyme, S subunit
MKLQRPKSWETAKLGELALLVLGGDWGEASTFDSPEYEEALCIRGSEFRNWDIDKGSTAVFRKIKKSSLSRRTLKEGDILIEISGGGPEQPVGRTVVMDRAALMQAQDKPKICTNFVRLLRAVVNVDSKYINYYLVFFYKSGKILDYQAGSNNLRNLKFKDYLNIELPIPPLAEQHRIVARIDELFSGLDKGVENLRLAQEQLNIFRQIILKNAFEGKLTETWRQKNQLKVRLPEQLQVDIRLAQEEVYKRLFNKWSSGEVGATKPKPLKLLPPLNTEELSFLPKLAHGWTWIRLGNFISSIEAGKSFRCEEREPSTQEIGVAKVSAISWGEYDESESKTCTDSSKVNNSYLISKDDFILSRSNTIELVGACVIVKNVSKKIMLSDKTLRIKFIELKPDYILEFLRSRIGRKQIMDLSTGNQDSMRNIGQERIRSIAIPVCSNDEVLEVVQVSKSYIDEIERLDAIIQSSLRHAEVLRQSILQKAFSGELVPQDPSDESASKLLARIKAEVTKLKSSKKKKVA